MPGRYIVNGVAYNSEAEARTALLKSGGGTTPGERIQTIPDTPKRIPSSAEKTIEFLRPLIMGAATGAGTYVGARIGAPRLGTAAGAITSIPLDLALQAFEGKEQDPTESLTQLAIQETGGWAAGKLYKIGKGIMAAKAGVAPEVMDQTVYDNLKRLRATYSQYMGKPVSKFIEDIFAAGSKSTRLKEQGALARKVEFEEVSPLTGKPTTTFEPHAFGNALQKDIQENFTSSIAESNLHAEVAEEIANDNTVQKVIAGKPFEVAGDIPIPESTLGALQNEFNILNAPNVTPQERLFQTQIQGFIAKAKAGLIGFRDAWNFKQAADIYGYGKKELGPEVSGAQRISAELNDAIESGIKKWTNGADDALNAFNNSKAIVRQRELTFGKKAAPEIARARTSTKSIVSTLDAALKDPNQIQRILNAGELTLPTGKVLTTNARGDLQGYAFARVLQDGWKSKNMVDPNMGEFIANDLFKSWQDPLKQESFAKLYPQAAQERLSKLLMAIATISEKQNTAGKIAADIRIGGAGITLGAGLLAQGLEFVGGTTGGRTAATVVGLSLGLNLLGKTMVNPTAGRFLYNIVAGQPLGASKRFAAKMIFNTMQGAHGVLEMSDGTKIPGKIIKGGKFQPLTAPE